MPFLLGFRFPKKTSKTTLPDKSLKQLTAPSGLVNKWPISGKSTFWLQTRTFPPGKAALSMDIQGSSMLGKFLIGWKLHYLKGI